VTEYDAAFAAAEIAGGEARAAMAITLWVGSLTVFWPATTSMLGMDWRSMLLIYAAVMLAHARGPLRRRAARHVHAEMARHRANLRPPGITSTLASLAGRLRLRHAYNLPALMLPVLRGGLG
jgi:hypothetical protein